MDAAAHPERIRASVSTAARRLVRCAISNDINAAWYAERKFLIGYSLIFLQVRENERRIAPFVVASGQRAYLKSGRIDGHDQVVVVGFGVPGNELQCERSGDRRVDITGHEIADDVPLAR